ncbi:MAG: sulfocyanin-like copper-binding protein [Gemmatimonadota bacterium]
MNRTISTGLAALFSFALVACGGGEGGGETAETQTVAETPAAEAAQGGELSMPGWMEVDHAARTVSLRITAGETDLNNHWNFNGHANGDATVVVPEGYEVTINFHNADPVNPHSLAVDARTGDFPAMFDDATPVFAGAETPGAASMTDATQPEGDATITFTADTAGEYSLVCWVPAHAATGMWIGFAVSGSGEAGVRTN